MDNVIPVVWLSNKPHALARGYWDQGILEAIFDKSLWAPVNGHEYSHYCLEDLPLDTIGAIVIIPARWHIDDVGWINSILAKLTDWALVILCGDEEGLFPWRKLVHHNMKIWIQTPYPNKHADVDRKFGDGWPPTCRNILKGIGPQQKEGWFFSGQVRDSKRRQECVYNLTKRIAKKKDGVLNPTDIFGGGLEYTEYLRHMAKAKVAISPSGFYTCDSFRFFEALEAGCVPIVERSSHFNPPYDYWEFLFDGDFPIQQVSNWYETPPALNQAFTEWPDNANKIYAWWQWKKRDMAYWMEEDLTKLSGPLTRDPKVSDLITILVPTSPSSAHPDPSITLETIKSIRAYPELANAEMIVMFDGVRKELEGLKGNYAEYIRRMLWETNFQHNTLPLLFDTHQHQANMTREALKLVRTPYVLFVESDTPIYNPIYWEGLCRAIRSGIANVIRLHHESEILEVHKHLMLSVFPRDVEGVPLMRTVQWSQRPHLASAGYYRHILDTHFTANEKWFIEDRMHSVLECAWNDHGEGGWDRHKLWIYAPPGDMKRSWHLDARQGGAKWDNYS